jgi:hypothetical protein
MTVLNAICTNALCDVFLQDYATEINGPSPSFCPKCGAGVIEHCPNPKCGVETPKHGLPAPNHCGICGQRFRFQPDSNGTVVVIVDQV